MSKSFSMRLIKQHHDFEFADLTAEVKDEAKNVIWTYQGRHHRRTEYTGAEYEAIMNALFNNAQSVGGGDEAMVELYLQGLVLVI